MKPTREYVIRKFEFFNRLIFGGKLPALPIVMTDSGRFLGKCCYKVTRKSDGTTENHSFELRINSRMDMDPDTVDDVIVHEMIHYFIAVNQLRDTAPHGTIFKGMMQAVNLMHGRHVSVTYRSDATERESLVDTRRIWHVIAGVRMRSGERHVKVLPRNAAKIIYWVRNVEADSRVSSVSLHLHDNPFFNRYPTSAALRTHPIEESVLENNLNGSRPLAIEGNKIIETRLKTRPDKR